MQSGVKSGTPVLGRLRKHIVVRAGDEQAAAGPFVAVFRVDEPRTIAVDAPHDQETEALHRQPSRQEGTGTRRVHNGTHAEHGFVCDMIPSTKGAREGV